MENKHQLQWIDYIWIVGLFLLYTFGAVTGGMYVAIPVVFLCASLIHCRFRFSLRKMYSVVWIAFFFGISIIVAGRTGYMNKAVNISAIEVFVMVVAMALYAVDSSKLEKLIIDFAYAAMFFAVVVLITSPVSTWGTLGFQGITGRQRNTTAFLVGVATIVFCYLYLQYRKKKYVFFSLVCVLTTILTGSRKGIIQLLIPIFVYLISQKGIKRTIKRILLVGLIGLLGLVIVLNNETFMTIYGDRFWQMFSILIGDEITDTSVRYRSLLAEIGWQSFYKKPVFGWGLGASWKLSEQLVSLYFHNNIIEILACTGIVGFVIYYYPIIRSFIKSFIERKKTQFDMLLLCITLVFLVLSYGQVTVYYCHFYQVIFFIVQYYALNRK